MNSDTRQAIVIALSGGGIRAMAFHLGVLKCIAEFGAMERISKVSSVSGGSLLVGLILHEHGMQWPTSQQFLEHTYPVLRGKLCNSSLLPGAFRALLSFKNWRFLLSRANLLARAIESTWGIREKVTDLPARPEISLNGTTAENGKRFRFKRDSMGDYLLGYAAPGKFLLADALAMSAAVPGIFGPLAVSASEYSWKRLPTWDAPPETIQHVPASFDKLHLYDGGVYDNLGIEPFFDCGSNKIKADAAGAFVLVSDAGAVLQSGFDLGWFNVMRLKRMSDIQSDQARSLRVRAFLNFLNGSSSDGAYIYIAEPTVAFDAVAAPAVFYRTTLTPLTESDFDSIAGRGYQVASLNKQLATLNSCAQ